MNFTAVRGFNAYAQFTAKIREAANSGNDVSKEAEKTQDDSYSLFSEPVDTVTISTRARNAAMKAQTPHTELREWMRTNGKATKIISGSFSQKVSGRVMNKALTGTGITVGNDEEYDVNVDMLSMVTVAGKNAEKAKAIQDLLRSTPMGINWGLLLAKLPPM